MIYVSIAFALYVGFMLFFLYFCMFADPEESKIAEYLTETFPQEVWNVCTRIVGKKNANALQWVADRALVFVYIVVVFGSWSVIFNYVYPWISSQSYVSQHHKTVGYFVFVACAASWRHASTSSPGIITKKTVALYDHFPYDDLMFVAGKTCPTRHVPRLARSKYDRYKYKQHIPRFDHFCGWLHNSVGEENYRWFLLFLTIHVGMCLYGSIVLCFLFHGHIIEKDLYNVTFFNRATGEEIAPGNLFFLAQYLFHKFFVESCVLVLMGVMAVALGGFLLYHVWITSVGLTTNETFKWDEIKKWHKAETKKYQQAVKDGLVVDGKSKAPAVSDGDVTCTPGQSAKESPAANDDAAIQDPGPTPVNIYDRGLYENWKQVIFPISVRRRKEMQRKAD